MHLQERCWVLIGDIALDGVEHSLGAALSPCSGDNAVGIEDIADSKSDSSLGRLFTLVAVGYARAYFASERH